MHFRYRGNVIFQAFEERCQFLRVAGRHAVVVCPLKTRAPSDRLPPHDDLAHRFDIVSRAILHKELLALQNAKQRIQARMSSIIFSVERSKHVISGPSRLVLYHWCSV